MVPHNSGPVAGETVLRSKDGAWGLSDDKNNGGSHLRANGKPAGAVREEHLNASSSAYGHLERIGVLADMDSSPRTLQFYRDGMLIPHATVSGFPETVYIAATPKRKGVKVHLSFPGGPTQLEPSTGSGTLAAAPGGRSGETLWKIAATAVEPRLVSAAAGERKQSVWKAAQEVVRKRRADLKQNTTPCKLVYTEPGPLGIAFGYEGGVTWVEAVSRQGMTASLTSGIERDIEGYVVTEVDGEHAGEFQDIAEHIRSGKRPITFAFTYPTKEQEKVIRNAEKQWIKEDRRIDKMKLQQAKAAAKVTGQEMKEEAAAYKHEVKQASKINKETGKLARGSNDTHRSKAKAGWKTLKHKVPEELKRKKKPSLFEMAALEQANVDALVARSAPHRQNGLAMQASSIRKDEPENSNSTGEAVGKSASLAATRAKTRNVLLQGLRNGKLASAVELAELASPATTEARETHSHSTVACGTEGDASPRRDATNDDTSRLAATRAKTRGALLQGLRSGKLAEAVETMDAATVAAPLPYLGGRLPAQTTIGQNPVEGSGLDGGASSEFTETKIAIVELQQQLDASKSECAELGVLATQFVVGRTCPRTVHSHFA